MKFRFLVHEVPAEEGGGFWAEVPALPGCMTQGDTQDEVESNLKEAINGVDVIADEHEALIGCCQQYFLIACITKGAKMPEGQMRNFALWDDTLYCRYNPFGNMRVQ